LIFDLGVDTVKVSAIHSWHIPLAGYFWILDTGYWMLDAGYEIQYYGYGIRD
jgi:hypothetical protein